MRAPPHNTPNSPPTFDSSQVMTMSFHHLAKGFFPGAGQCSETGAGNGRDFNLNIPLKEGDFLIRYDYYCHWLLLLCCRFLLTRSAVIIRVALVRVGLVA